jgi:hypothetical protein
MFHDEKRLKKSRPLEEYEAHAISLTDSEKMALSRIGIENFKFMMEEYVHLLNSQEDASIYITDFYSWCEIAMIIYDYNTKCEMISKEIDELTK